LFLLKEKELLKFYDGDPEEKFVFKGLASFGYVDAHLFAGRDKDKERLYKALTKDEILVVSGKSGRKKMQDRN